MGMRNLGGLTLAVTIMVIIDALTTPAVLLSGLLFPEAYAQYVTPIANQVDLATLAVTLLTFVVFGRWIFVAGSNLVEAGYQDLEFTPAARIWWFAVPFANLVKPFQGMRELWNASHGEGDYTLNDGRVSAWWGLWLLHGFVGYFAQMAAGPNAGTAPFWFQSAAGIALAVAAIRLIRGIAEAQPKLAAPELAEIFA